MNWFLTWSCGLHAFLIVAMVAFSTLLSRPSKSYYSIDLMSSAPSGGGPGAGPTVTPTPKATPAPEAPKIKVPKVAPAPPAPAPAADEEPAEDTMRMLANLKKKRMAQQKKSYDDGPVRGADRSSRQDDTPATDRSGGGNGAGGFGTGAGIVAAAGTPFPFPWYLKAIADRLDKQWKPPEGNSSDTVCQVTFVINRAGQISGSQLTKSSRETLFDELALRAVLSSNPMPPLPNGYPESSLKVHMKFVGKE